MKEEGYDFLFITTAIAIGERAAPIFLRNKRAELVLWYSLIGVCTQEKICVFIYVVYSLILLEMGLVRDTPILFSFVYS